VALTRTLVGIESVNPALDANGSGEGAMAVAIAELLDHWGWAPEVIEVAPGRPNVRAARGDGNGPSLLLNGHLDTVGVDGMTVDPFASETRDGRMYGRGACDMKSGLAIILAVAHRLRTEPIPGRLELLFTADEEHASIGMAAAVGADAEGADAAAHRSFEPLSADFAVVTEPTSLAVMPAHKGFSWVRADVVGRAAHGSRPDVGIDAIRSAGRLLGALDELERRLVARAPHPLLGFGSVHGGTIHGGVAPSVYPERCAVRLERRTLPDEDPQGFERELRELFDAVRAAHPEVVFELDTELVRPGSDVACDDPGVVALLDALEREGLPRRVEGMTAWVDAAWLNGVGIPAICFGPGSIEQAHSADEWVDLLQIERGAEVLERFARGRLGVGR
jgi:acetylornithine deacetylase